MSLCTLIVMYTYSVHNDIHYNKCSIYYQLTSPFITKCGWYINSNGETMLSCYRNITHKVIYWISKDHVILPQLKLLVYRMMWVHE